jgi:maltose-binding protein MalE
MNSQFLKRAGSLVISGLMVASLLVGCKPTEPAPTQPPANTQAPANTEKKPEDFTGKIVFGHFNNDEATPIAEAFKEKYKNVEVELQITADTNGAYQTLMTQALRTGTDVPDVYASENAFVKRFVNIQNGYEDLSAAPYNAEELKTKLVPYTIDIGRSDDGKIRALSHQAAVAAVGYKRDLAKQYLGTDDPAEIGKMFASGQKIVETGKELKSKSGGKAILFPGMAELMRMYLGARDSAWVENGKLVIDPKMEEFVKIAKELRDAGAEGGLEAWTDQWSAAIKDDVHFAYAIPTWGIPWIIDVNQEDSKKETGDWALAEAPAPYCWGGTWFGIYSGSQNKDLAWEFIKFLTLDEEQSEAWARKSGDFVSNLNVIEKMSNDSSYISKTINQNPYTFFAPMVGDINGAIITQHDDTITNAFQDAMLSYLAGTIKTEEDMWKQFKNQVRNDLNELTVE